MGFFLTALSQRRWLTVTGFAALLISLLLPRDSTIRIVVAGVGLVLILVQIPLAVRQSRRDRETPR